MLHIKIMIVNDPNGFCCWNFVGRLVISFYIFKKGWLKEQSEKTKLFYVSLDGSKDYLERGNIALMIIYHEPNIICIKFLLFSIYSSCWMHVAKPGSIIGALKQVIHEEAPP